MSITWRKEGVLPESASRTCDDGKQERGELYRIEKIFQSGMLKAIYEYNIYHWLESGEWTGDVVSPHGWYDLDAPELKRVVRELTSPSHHTA